MVEKVYIDSDLELKVLTGLVGEPPLKAGCRCQLNVVWYLEEVSSYSGTSAKHVAVANMLSKNELVTNATLPREYR